MAAGLRSEERRAELEAQRLALATACERRGWQPLEAVEEAGRSAKDLQPPGGEQALRALGRAEAQPLVVGKRERPAQALLELDCALEPTTPGGEPHANLLASFAPCERGLHSERIRAALARKRAQGVRLGRPPSMSPHALERIRRERAAGKSLAAIADGLNAARIPTAQGGRRWYPATVRYTLQRAS